MTRETTLDFYNQEAHRYAKLRARPIQLYTDEVERAALHPYVLCASQILDLGCGEGRLTRWMAEQKQAQDGTFQVQGADFSPQMIEQAKRFNGSLPATYSVGDAMNLDFADNSFDLIVSCTAPNNFPDLAKALEEIHRVLNPGGVFFATIINKHEAARFSRYVYYAPYFLWQGIKRLMGGKSGYHRVLFSRDELEAMLLRHFHIEELSGLRMLPDFVPEFPLNIWPPLFPIMEGFLKMSGRLDQRLARHPDYSRYARFHLVIARAVK